MPERWPYLMYIVAILYGVNAILILVIFKPYPEELGLVIDLEEKVRVLREREEYQAL